MREQRSTGKRVAAAAISAALLLGAALIVLFLIRPWEGETPERVAPEAEPAKIAAAPEKGTEPAEPAKVEPKPEAAPEAKEDEPEAAATEEEAGGPGIIRGKVIAKADGSPIEGVTVGAKADEPEKGGEKQGAPFVHVDSIALEAAAAKAETDAGGAFELKGLALRKYRLFVHNGDKAFEPLPPRRGPVVDLQEKPEVEGIEIVLTEGAVFFGEVWNQGKEPIEGAKVQTAPADIFDEMFKEGLSIIAGSGETHTSEKGEWRIAGLPFGRKYIVAASAEGLARAMTETIETKPEEPEVRIDFELTPGSRVTGRVVDEDGAPVAGLQLAIITGDMMRGIGPHEAKTAPDGTFAFDGLLAGKHTISAVEREKGPNSLQALGEVEVDGLGPREGLEFVYKRSGPAEITLTGRAVDDAATPVEGASILVSGLGAGGKPVVRNGTTAADGTFRFENVPKGLLTISGTKAGHAKAVIVSATGEPGPHELVMARAGRVTGIVIAKATEEPLAGAIVQAIPTGDAANSLVRMMGGGMPTELASATAGADGTFAIEVEPGTMRLRASASGYALAFSDEISIAPAERREKVVIALSGGGSIAGRVLDPDGQPVPGAQVTSALQGDDPVSNLLGRMLPVMAGPAIARATAGDDGSFTIEHLAAGTHRLTATAPLFAESAAKDIELHGEEGIRDFIIHLRRPAEIRGRLLREGEPVGGTMVQLMGAGAMKMTTTLPDGSFSFLEIAPGEYILNFMNLTSIISGKGLGDLRSMHAEAIAGRTTDLEIDLDAGAKIRGRIRGAPEGTTLFVTLRRPGSIAPENVEPFDMEASIAASRDQVGMAFVQADGSYVVEGVPDGKFIIEVPAMPIGEGGMALDTAGKEPLYRGEIEIKDGEDKTFDIRIKAEKEKADEIPPPGSAPPPGAGPPPPADSSG
ncbi:MAG: carboxypeptidase regulatory-like domain-containing protein [Planctomycetes bacterium]|nr:carboxypeptidase regulatory-like domain-containing protein [Planctomycetota bacterium]